MNTLYREAVSWDLDDTLITREAITRILGALAALYIWQGYSHWY